MKLKLERTPEMDEALEAQRNEVDRIVKFMRTYPLSVRRTEYPDHVELELWMGPDDTAILRTVKRHAAKRLEQALCDLATLARAAEIERAVKRDGARFTAFQKALKRREADAVAHKVASEEKSKQRHGYTKRAALALESRGLIIPRSRLKKLT